MKQNMSMCTTMLLAASLALPVLATAAPAPQSGDNANAQPVATLQVSGGVVMLSRAGSPFVSGQSDESLFSGERLMVSANSSATVVYHDGCRQNYDKPGVYTIGANCTAAAVAPAAAGTPAAGAGSMIAFGAGALVTGGLVGAVIKGRQTSVPPVSH